MFLRVKKVKNVSSLIFRKISPEKSFDAGSSKIWSVWQNFDPFHMHRIYDIPSSQSSGYFHDEDSQMPNISDEG